VSQHGPSHHVTNGKDTIYFGLPVFIDHDAAYFVEFDTKFFSAKSFSVGFAASGNEYVVSSECLASTTFHGFKCDIYTSA
jgi:hypothetical protein